MNILLFSKSPKQWEKQQQQQQQGGRSFDKSLFTYGKNVGAVKKLKTVFHWLIVFKVLYYSASTGV